MPDQDAVYDWQLPAHCTLGARGGAGGDASSPGENARGGAHPPADCGACVRYAEILDGIHALPDEATTQRAHRDEFARAGLQLETSDADLRGRTADAGDQGVTAPFLPRHLSRVEPSAADDNAPLPHSIGQEPAFRNGRVLPQPGTENVGPVFRKDDVRVANQPARRYAGPTQL